MITTMRSEVLDDAVNAPQSQRGRGRRSFAQCALGMWSPDFSTHQPTDDAQPSTSIKVDSNNDIIIDQPVNIYFRPRAVGDATVMVFADDGTVLTRFSAAWNTKISQQWRTSASYLSVRSNAISSTNVALSGNITGVYAFNATHLNQIEDYTSLTNYQSLVYARCQPTPLSNGVTALTYPEVVPWNDAEKDIFPTSDESGFDYMPRYTGSTPMTGHQPEFTIDVPFSYANYGDVRIDFWFDEHDNNERPAFEGTATWVSGPGGSTSAQSNFNLAACGAHEVHSFVLRPSIRLKKGVGAPTPGAYLSSIHFSYVPDPDQPNLDYNDTVYYKIYFLDSVTGSYTGGVHVMRIDGLSEALPVNMFLRTAVEFVPTPSHMLTTPVDDAVAVVPVALEAARALLHNWDETGMSLYMQMSCYLPMLDVLRQYDYDVMKEIAAMDPGSSYFANASIASFLKGIWKNKLKPKLSAIARGGLQLAASEVAAPIYGFIPGGNYLQGAVRAVNDYVNNSDLDMLPNGAASTASAPMDDGLPVVQYTIPGAARASAYSVSFDDEDDVGQSLFDLEATGDGEDVPADSMSVAATGTTTSQRLLDILADQTWPTRISQVKTRYYSAKQLKEMRDQELTDEMLQNISDGKTITSTIPYSLPRAAFFPVVVENVAYASYLIASVEPDPLQEGEKDYTEMPQEFTGANFIAAVDTEITHTYAGADPNAAKRGKNNAALLVATFFNTSKRTAVGNAINARLRKYGYASMKIYFTIHHAQPIPANVRGIDGTSWAGAAASLGLGLTSGMAWAGVGATNVLIPYPASEKTIERNKVLVQCLPTVIDPNDFEAKFKCWYNHLEKMKPAYKQRLMEGSKIRPKVTDDFATYLSNMCARACMYVPPSATILSARSPVFNVPMTSLMFQNRIAGSELSVADILAAVTRVTSTARFVNPESTAPVAHLKTPTSVVHFCYYTGSILPLYLTTLPLTKKAWQDGVDQSDKALVSPRGLETMEKTLTAREQLMRAAGVGETEIGAMISAFSNALGATNSAPKFSRKTAPFPVTIKVPAKLTASQAKLGDLLRGFGYQIHNVLGTEVTITPDDMIAALKRGAFGAAKSTSRGGRFNVGFLTADD